jgi:hypothetical protein
MRRAASQKLVDARAPPSYGRIAYMPQGLGRNLYPTLSRLGRRAARKNRCYRKRASLFP